MEFFSTLSLTPQTNESEHYFVETVSDDYKPDKDDDDDDDDSCSSGVDENELEEESHSEEDIEEIAEKVPECFI